MICIYEPFCDSGGFCGLYIQPSDVLFRSNQHMINHLHNQGWWHLLLCSAFFCLCLCCATNRARCGFCATALPHFRDPDKSSFAWTDVTANCDVCLLQPPSFCTCAASALGSLDPVWLFDKEHSWRVRQQPIVCFPFRKHSGFYAL